MNDDTPEVKTNPDTENKWIRDRALQLAVEARIPSAGPEEIIRSAKQFEKYLTGNDDA